MNVLEAYLDSLYDHSGGLDPDAIDRVLKVVRTLATGGVCGQGAGRIVFFVGENLVLKAPRHEDGVRQNQVEAERHQELDLPTAPCRLLPESETLLMSKVHPVTFGETLPNWASKVDGLQVGWLDGKLLAFDYADQIPTDADFCQWKN